MERGDSYNGGMVHGLGMAAALLAAGWGGPQDEAAPELTGGTEWVNVKEPLTIAGLRGKIVILHFWTYG